MQIRWTLCTAAVATAWSGCAGWETHPDLASEGAREGYSLGLEVGAQMRESMDEIDRDAFVAGLADAFAETPRLAPDQVATALARMQEREFAAMEAERQAEVQQNRSQGDAFRAAFAEEPDTVALDNGLLYQVLVQGEGDVPSAGDRVTVHYRGLFVDGTEFDSSYARQQPASFPVDRVIEGWSEALTRMPVGSTWKVVLPPELAYGDEGAATRIGPGSTLVFELELIEIG